MLYRSDIDIFDDLSISSFTSSVSSVDGVSTDFFDSELLPRGSSVDDVYHYIGSLTTPPCTEGVRFFILDDEASIPQSDQDIMDGWWEDDTSFAGGNGNNRQVQPTNGRDVYIFNEITIERGYVPS